MEQNNLEQELYVLVGWPEVRDLMDKEGFDDNAFFRGDVAFPAYFVNKNWYDLVCYQDYAETVH